jgi:NAD(P)H dehydrogenase (quinone)
MLRAPLRANTAISTVLTPIKAQQVQAPYPSGPGTVPRKGSVVSRILVLYYSSCGHIESLAQAVAQGARSTGAEIAVKRVLMPEDVARSAGVKLDQPAPIADPEELANYDATNLGTPTRYGRLASQMANFLDRTGAFWMAGALVGKVGSVFCSTASQLGGPETTLASFYTNLLHHGMIVVGLPYTAAGLLRLDEITGGSPHGAGTIAGPHGERQPSRSVNGVGSLSRHAESVPSRSPCLQDIDARPTIVAGKISV